MPKVSVNILTKNRAELLKRALASVRAQTFTDYEVVVMNDGSRDNTLEVLDGFKLSILNLKIINHQSSLGITLSRQEALLASTGEYVAILDDDDEWIDPDKLKKQVEFLDNHQDYILTGGGIEISNFQFPISNEIQNPKSKIIKHRPASDAGIRNTMLFRNNFFTSTVMFRRQAALKAGGFKKDEFDVAEDYDLWLRMGLLGKMYNAQEAFTLYSVPDYNKEKFKQFLTKQLKLVEKYKQSYLYAFFAKMILTIRLWLLNN